MRKPNGWGALLILMLLSTFIVAQKPSKVARRYFDELFNPALYNALHWRNIGPFRGGRSVAVSGVVGQPLVYYMGSTGGGLWKTEDAGLSWRNISDPYFQAGSIGAIAVAPADPNIIYVGTGEHPPRAVMTSSGDGVYKSYDGGQSWEYLGLPKSQHIASICIHPENPDILFVAVQGALYGPGKERGVYKSIDGGRTWDKALYINDLTGATDLSIDWRNPRVLYAAMWDHQRFPWKIRSGGKGSAIYKSTDNGDNWFKLGGGLPEEMGKAAVKVSEVNSNIVYANVEAEDGGVFRSDDGGQNWIQTSKDRRTISRAWYYTEIFTDPLDPETVYVLNESLLKSIDGGRTFKDIPTAHPDQHHLWINPAQPRNMILANDGGACISFNGGQSWSGQNNQPTGQFYRVITDRRFPYHVYGAQQDNTTVGISSRTAQDGIGEKDWYPVTNCESAFLAFDPENPDLIYGSCFQGGVSLYNRQTQSEKDVMAYPEIGFATNPKELRYRFNWNAPIVASPHNPTVIYHAGNVVFRTDNEGLNWKIISPDLTRNDSAKQMEGGGPFTNEGAGAEVYNTISYLVCSPHQAGTIWAGTDDGQVHLTRNEGEKWTNITPIGLEESLINSIEVSPHRPGRAYVVATRYKFNDLRPLIYYTNDYGRNWEIITDGIAPNHFVRVVREDPQRPGLLYAGTEYGFYLSYDNGKKWRRFQLNIPVCPITDLTIRDNDLIAATSGRGFWILDDLSPLQHGLGKLKDAKMRLFPPKKAVRFETLSTSDHLSSVGKNPLNGVIIDYYLGEILDTTKLELQILDQNGELIRQYSNQKDPDYVFYEGGPSPKIALPSREGLNRFNWDLRRESMPGIPETFIFGDYRGSMIAPGVYTIRLKTAFETLEQKVEVLPDPRLKVELIAFTRQQEALRQIEKAISRIHLSIRDMRAVKEQIQRLNKSMKGIKGTESLIAKGSQVCQLIDEWEAELVQTQQRTYQDVIHFPNRLSAELMNLRTQIDNPDPRLTDGARQRLQDLLWQWRQAEQQIESIVKLEVETYNQLFREKQIPAVIVPAPTVDKP